MEHESTDKDVEQDAINPDNEFDLLRQVLDYEQARMQDIIGALGKRAILTIADTYEIERMGVLSNSPRLPQIDAERNGLLRNIGEASALWLRLEETIGEVERGIGSLQYLIDPENN